MKSGWQTKHLGDFCAIASGGTPSKDNPSFWVGDVPFVSARDLKSDRIETAFLHIAREAVEQSATRLAPVGSLLMLVRGMGLANGIQIGEVTASVAFNQDIRAIQPPLGSVLPRFLLLGLRNSFINGEGERALSSAAHGTLKIDADVLRQIAIPVPPLAEQQRIVGLLDEAFEGLATAKANAEKNLQNARALFESHLQSVFTQRGQGWVEKPLGDLATFRNGINFTKDSKGERIKIVGVRNFQKYFSAPLDDLDTVTIDGKLGELDSLMQDDILAVRSNGNIELIGRTLLVGKVSEKISHSGFTIRIRLSNGSVLPKYVCHFMKSTSSRKRLADGGTGTNIKSLNQGMLSALAIPFPPIHTQKALVKKLESTSAETQRLARLYERKLALLAAFKKSLLHQAFSGRL